MPLMIAALIAVIVLTFQSFAHASPQPRGSTFAATVDDGTPHVIRVKKTQISEEESQVVEADGKEEYLESMSKPQAAPQPDTLEALKAEVEALKAQMQAMKSETSLTPATATPGPNIVTAAPAPIKQLRTAGERVPEAHKGEMSKRISAASQILKKYGIAYDYRVMTLKDFIRIEARLSKLASEKSQGESAPSESLSEN